MRDAVIVDIIRTASGKGKKRGALNDMHPVDLLGSTLCGPLDRNDLDPALVDDVIAGCVSQVGQQSSNVARSAVLAVGLPDSAPGTIALGHPLGASGTRLMCTLLSQLESTGGRYGLQTMCEAGAWPMRRSSSGSSVARAARLDAV
jgi:acetyl-CoA acetyltransferase